MLQVNDCTRAEIVKGLRALFGVPNFKPMALDEIDRALSWFDAGMDFGDAVHLALSAKADGFVTFDRALAKRAVKSGAFPSVAVA